MPTTSSQTKQVPIKQHLDAIVLAHWASVLHECLSGAKISKVNHLNHRDFCFTLWGHHLNKENNRLVISINKQAPACFLTDTQTVSDTCERTFESPTGFCMLLRKHLQNGVIQSVKTLTGERAIVFTIRNTNEMGQQVYWQIIAELMGRNSNLLLVEQDTQTITGTAHHVTDTMSRTREVYPGIPYTPPPTPKHKQWIGSATSQALLPLFEQHATTTSLKELSASLFSHYWGCGQLTLQTILKQPSVDHQIHQLLHWAQPLPETYQSIQPHFSDPKGLQFTPLSSPLLEKEESLIQWQQAMAAFYVTQLTQLAIAQEGRTLSQAITRARQKLAEQSGLDPEAQQEKAEQHQYYGDRLTTAISTKEVPPHHPTKTTLSLSDWTASNTDSDHNESTDGLIHIPIDLAKNWQENAQAHYQKSKKLTRQAAYQAQQKEAHEQQQAYYNQLEWSLTNATTAAELRDIRDELMREGLLRDRYAQSKKQHVKRKQQQQPQTITAGLLQATNKEGVRFWIGKQNKANDLLVGKLSKPHDMWLHAHQMPGAHVVIITEGHEVSDDTLHDGLHLAAYFSPGRLSPNLPVIYTQRRYVKKIPGSYPGHVNYREEYTAYITADEQRVKQLLAQNTNC